MKLFLFLIFFSGSFSFSTELCEMLIGGPATKELLGKISPGYVNFYSYFNPKMYHDSKKVLVISDGRSYSIGKEILKFYPKKKVVMTTFSRARKAFESLFGINFNEKKNQQKLHVDNNKSLPFPDQYFDSIVMRRGLCVCDKEKCCAGFRPDSGEAFNFFDEVIRVFNKSSPGAFVILHGGIDLTEERIAIWKEGFDFFEEKYGVKIQIFYENEITRTGVKRFFHFVKIVNDTES